MVTFRSYGDFILILYSAPSIAYCFRAVITHHNISSTAFISDYLHAIWLISHVEQGNLISSSIFISFLQGIQK